eukprot:scaffold288830_cov30-Tisochrysis_lutea.AAC.1
MRLPFGGGCLGPGIPRWGARLINGRYAPSTGPTSWPMQLMGRIVRRPQHVRLLTSSGRMQCCPRRRMKQIR